MLFKLETKPLTTMKTSVCFLTTRNPLPDITPDAASIISEVNFTTTKAGLTAQVCKEY